MEARLRQATQGLLVLMGCGLLGLTVMAIDHGWGWPSIALLVVGLVVVGLLLLAARRSWRHGPALTIMVAIVLAAWGPPTSELDTGNALTLLIPAVVALIVGRSWWIVAATVATIALFLARSGGQSLLSSSPVDALVFGMLVGGLWFGRWIIEQALRVAEEHGRRAEAALVEVAASAEQLAAASRHQAAQLAEQQALLDLVATLEVPVISLADGVLLSPLLGHLDRRRTQAVTARLLQVVHEQRTSCVVLDLAGVAAVDAVVAEEILAAARALRLLGCEVLLSGITARVARTVAELDLNLAGVRVVPSPQAALQAMTRR